MAAISITIDGTVAGAIDRAKRSGEKYIDRDLHEVDREALRLIEVGEAHEDSWFGHSYTITLSRLDQLLAIANLNEDNGIRLHVGYKGLGRDDPDETDTIYVSFYQPEYAS